MSCITATTLVPIQHPTGMELTANLAFETSPKRLQTRSQTLRTYILKYPRGWKKRLELADILCTLGDWPQAIQEYRGVLDRQPQLLHVWLQLGQLMRLLDQPKEAIAVYQTALEQVSDSATCHHIQGLIHECDEHHIAAKLAYQQAVDAEANNTAHWFALAQTHVRNDEYEAAMTAYDHILEQQPNDAIALSHKADLFWAMSAYADSIKVTEEVLAIAPNHASGTKRLLDHRCRNRLVQGNEKKLTHQLLKRLQKLAPHTPETAQSEANYYAAQGNLSRAKDTLAVYCHQHPNNPFGFYYNALFLYDEGETQASATNIWQAYQRYPTKIGIFRTLCEISQVVGYDARFNQVLEQQVERASTQWQVGLVCGRAFVNFGHEPSRGCEVAKQAVHLRPELAITWFQYGDILAQCHYYQAAIDAITRGWELLPRQYFCASSIPAAVQLADCHQILGNVEASVHWWNQVVERSHQLSSFFPNMSRRWRQRAHEALSGL